MYRYVTAAFMQYRYYLLGKLGRNYTGTGILTDADFVLSLAIIRFCNKSTVILRRKIGGCTESCLFCVLSLFIINDYEFTN
jgi:hypothetical protein